MICSGCNALPFSAVWPSVLCGLPRVDRPASGGTVLPAVDRAAGGPAAGGNDMPPALDSRPRQRAGRCGGASRASRSRALRRFSRPAGPRRRFSGPGPILPPPGPLRRFSRPGPILPPPGPVRRFSRPPSPPQARNQRPPAGIPLV